MPSGKAHFRMEMLFWPVCALGYYYLMLPKPVELAIFAAAYLIASLFLSPDLDLHKNISKRRWGPLGFIWRPYSTLFKHRRISHSLMWGPITRLIYFGVLVGATAYGLTYLGFYLSGSDFYWLKENLLLAIIVGLYLPNILHVLIDRTRSVFKRAVNQRAFLR